MAKRRKPKKTPFWTTVWSNVKKYYGIAVIVFTIIGFKYQIVQLFSTQHQIFEKEEFVKGLLVTDPYKETDYFIYYGSSVYAKYSTSQLKKGIAFAPNGLSWGGEVPFNMKLLMKDNRLFVSATFKYLENKELMGTLEYNKWSVRKSNIRDYYDDGRFLEVVDKQGNVAFQLSFESANVLRLKGYSIISNGNVMVLSDSVAFLQANDKVKIQKAVESIKPLHASR